MRSLDEIAKALVATASWEPPVNTTKGRGRKPIPGSVAQRFGRPSEAMLKSMSEFVEQHGDINLDILNHPYVLELIKREQADRLNKQRGARRRAGPMTATSMNKVALMKRIEEAWLGLQRKNHTASSAAVALRKQFPEITQSTLRKHIAIVKKLARHRQQ